MKSKLILLFVTLYLLLAPQRASADATITLGEGSINTNEGTMCNMTALFCLPVTSSVEGPPSQTRGCPLVTIPNSNITIGPTEVIGMFSGDAHQATMTTTGNGGVARTSSENCSTSGAIVFKVTGQPTSVEISVSMSFSGQDSNGNVTLTGGDGVILGSISGDENGQQ